MHSGTYCWGVTPFADELRRFIAELSHADPAELLEDLPLFVRGYLDSLNLVDVVTFVERRCGVRVPAGDLTLDHFGSLRSIAAYVERRAPS